MEQYTKDQQRKTAIGFNRWSRCCLQSDDVDMMIAFVNAGYYVRCGVDFHNHWIKQKITDGWKFGLYYSDEMKTDPRMCEFTQLDEDVRQHIIDMMCIISTFD
jgi:hypothetical protein